MSPLVVWTRAPRGARSDWMSPLLELSVSESSAPSTTI
jgi:hypothetical protein